jgi:hypothetical protein
VAKHKYAQEHVLTEVMFLDVLGPNEMDLIVLNIATYDAKLAIMTSFTSTIPISSTHRLREQ